MEIMCPVCSLAVTGWNPSKPLPSCCECNAMMEEVGPITVLLISRKVSRASDLLRTTLCPPGYPPGLAKWERPDEEE